MMVTDRARRLDLGSMPRLLRASLPVLILGAIAADARAGEVKTDTWAWGLAGMEVSGAAYASLRFGAKVIPDDGFAGLAANVSPALIGAGLGLAADHYDLDGRPALAAHGAVWGGFDGFLIGTVIGGRNEREGLRVGTATWAMTAVGAVAGGVLGGTAGNRWREGWMALPSVGMLAGVVFGGVYVIGSGDLYRDRGAQHLTMGIAGGMTAGIVVAAVIGFSQPSSAAPGAASARTFTPQLDRDRVVVSFGGSF
jgi:hypothetical protein